MCLFRSFCYYKSFLMNKNSKNNNKPGQKTLFQFWKSNSDVTQQQQQQQQNADNTIQSAKSNQIQNKPSTFSKNQSDLTSAVSSKTTTNNATNINNTKFSCMKDGDDDEIKFLNELNNENLNEDGVNDEDNNDDDDDLELIETTDRFLNETYKQQNQKETLISEALTVGIEDNMLQCTQHTNTNGFDDDAGAIWIYPTNYPIRDYQYNIVQQCLFKNTMVVLPTGLGKTFVAAVVMFNFYRWYPTGKIMFMAPTRPLVLQQADACYKIMGIPKSDLSQMTGTTSQNDRKVQWSTKRVFFLTPQIVMNDLLKGIVDVNLIKCVVIDEAHKASGDYAFCKVIEAVNKQNKNFRVVALTATPGNDIRAIQNVIQNLLISHIELRSDDSIDIQRYNNSRQVDKYVLKLNSELVQIKDIFMNVMKNPVKRLEISRVFYAKEIASLTKLFVLDRREQFRKNPPAGLDQRRVGMIEGDFAMIISFLHGLELLLLYGIKSFYMFLKSFIDGENNSAQQSRIKNELMNNKDAADMYARLKNTFENSDKSFVVPQNMRHPKLIKLEELVLEHFNGFKGSTRVMIFSQYRESVYEIKEMLSAHEPIIKCMEFVGQSATQGTRKGVTQKEQLNVVKQFRDGGYNTLVSTCVGEEGLDIGEVDLIVCFDSQKSPIRLIQRMGRTGRKREGRIIILLTEGKEEASYNTSLYKKKNIYKTILNSSKTLKFYENNPLMTPKNMKPKCHQMFINTPEEEKPADEATTKKGRKPQQTKLSKAAQKTKVNIEDELDDNPIQTEDTSNQTEPNTSKTKTRKTTKKKENEQTNSKINEKTINSADTSKEMVPNKKQKTSLKMSDFSTEKRASISNDGVANRVKEPPNFDLKCIDKITSETFQEINIHELLEEWKCDEDEFLKFDSQSNNDQSHEESVESIMKKFDDFYQELLASIPPGVTGESEDSEDSDEEMDNEDNQMQIVEEEIVNHSKIESEVNKHGDSYQSIINDTISNENYYNLEFACNNRYEIYKEDANKSPNNAQKNEDENKDDLKINSNKEVFCESKETDNRETNNKFDQFNMFGVDLNDLFGSSESETNNNKNEQNMLGTDLNDLFDSNENESGDTHKNENEGIVFSQKDKKFDNLSLCDELLEQIETSMDIDYDALMAKANLI